MFLFSHSTYRSCLCAFCRKPRQVYMKRHLNWTDVGSLLVVSLTLSGLVWHRLEPRAILVFVTLIVLTETIVQFRWRMGLACSSCGFDPLLYARRPEAARAR